jgi:triosephosphate isomerase
MAKNLIVANWKSHKTIEETHQYFSLFSEKKDQITVNSTEIVICPPYIGLETAKRICDESSLPVTLGCQNISPYEQGAYTGEISASQVSSLVRYVIIGHSERRNNFLETEEIIKQKIEQAKKSNLSVILCVQGSDTPVYENVDVIAYEPVSAIGTGNPDTPENVTNVLQQLHEKSPHSLLLYGGSVDTTSIQSFLTIEQLSGFLVGGASLDPDTFIHLVSACETRNSY